MPISINVNVDKIDKRKLFPGKKGRYLDLVLWETEGKSEEYGDYIVKQRGEQGDKMPILGNGKFFKKERSNRGPDHNDKQDRDDDVF